MDYKTISKNTSIGDAKEILNINGIKTPRGWELVMGMLLQQCHHLEVDGYGSSARFYLYDEDNNPVEYKEIKI